MPVLKNQHPLTFKHIKEIKNPKKTVKLWIVNWNSEIKAKNRK